MNKKLVPLSRFLSLVLRHQPESIGLTLDAQGWADVDELIARCNARGKKLTRATLMAIVTTNDKQRFRLNDDQTRIRASQGHSIPVDLGLIAIEPPDILYHGTAEKNLGLIYAQGLIKQSRQHVHLSVDTLTATKVGARHGKVVVLTVQAGEMHRQGMAFYRSDNGVWLTDCVPPEYLKFDVE